jgi:hypothetical protein
MFEVSGPVANGKMYVDTAPGGSAKLTVAPERDAARVTLVAVPQPEIRTAAAAAAARQERCRDFMPVTSQTGATESVALATPGDRLSEIRWLVKGQIR